MSHRNLGLFLSEENGENKITAEALDESRPIDAEGLDKALYDIDEKSVEDKPWQLSIQ